MTAFIGISPPRQRPGRTLGPNLDCTQVSLSLRMCYRLKCNHIYLLHGYLSLTPVYVNLKVPSFSVENSPTLKLKYPYVNKTYLHKGLNVLIPVNSGRESAAKPTGYSGLIQTPQD